MKEPKNQHQLALWYLLNWKKPFSIKDLINDSMFFKFQTRLSEIEKDHGSISIKEREDFVNRFDRKSNYFTYKARNKSKIIELYDLY
jgi:hypothetical protein